MPVGGVPDGEPEVPGVEPELPGVEPEVLGVELGVLALATHIIKVGILDDNFQIVIGITSRLRLRRGMLVDVPEMRPLA